MERNELATLPQGTAQFDLLFGAALVSGLLPLLATARLWLGILFYLGGVNNLLMWHHTRLLVHHKLATATGLGSALPPFVSSCMALSASLAQMAASAVFMLGLPGLTRPAAMVLLAFLLPVTVSVHDLWNAGHDSAAEYRDPSAPTVGVYTARMGRPAERSTAAAAAGTASTSTSTAAAAGAGGSGSTRQAAAAEAEAEGAAASSKPKGRGRAGKAAAAADEDEAAASVVRARKGSKGSASRGRRGGAAVAEAEAAEEVESEAPGRLPCPVPAAATGSAAGVGAGAWPQPILPFQDPAAPVPTFLDAFSNEFVHFFKNCGMAGGLLLVLALEQEAA